MKSFYHPRNLSEKINDFQNVFRMFLKILHTLSLCLLFHLMKIKYFSFFFRCIENTLVDNQIHLKSLSFIHIYLRVHVRLECIFDISCFTQ